MSIKRWKIPKLDRDLAAALAEQCEINPFLAILLTRQGIDSFEKVESFLFSSEGDDDPFIFADMEVAVSRINLGVETGEKIAIYGDYDVDGVTSTALVYLYLKSQGAEVLYYIPHRQDEGYGMSKEGIDSLAAAGATLIITVDNGISAADEVAYAKSIGVDVVVTDHHMPPEKLPDAAAVVNPHRADCPSGFKDYAGVGVAFKLVSALEGDFEPILYEYGDLVALGTLADMMPLVGENRFLVKEGLKTINRRERAGLSLLLDAFGMEGKEVLSTNLTFSVIPALNSVGRMDAAEGAFKLLISDTDKDEAKGYLDHIIESNKKRREVTDRIFAEALANLQSSSLVYDRVIVVNGEGWHHGVIGIIAARLAERYGKPSIVLSCDGEEATGSGRSFEGFDLYSAVASCSDILTRYGGHSAAAGISLAKGNIENFRRAVNEFARVNYPVMPVMSVDVKLKLNPSQIDIEKLDLISILEPFGMGNETPIFGIFKVRLDNITPISQGRHLRLSLSKDDTRITAMRFGVTPDEFPFSCGQVLNLLVTLDKNEFKGVISPSIYIRDIRLAGLDEEELISSFISFDAIMRDEKAAVDFYRKDPLTRRHVEQVYRFLRDKLSWHGTLDQLVYLVEGEGLTFIHARVALEILSQAGLVQLNDNGDSYDVKIIPPKGKVNLEETPLAQKLAVAL